MEEKVWIVVGNVGTGAGYVVEKFWDDIWESGNPGGWTWQELTSPSRGTILGALDSEAEANAVLNRWLETGTV